MLVSLALGLRRLMSKRLRHTAAAAFIGPIAFAGCSIVSMFAILLTLEHFGIERAVGIGGDVSAWHVIVVLAFIYVLPGVIGAFLAVWVTNRTQRLILNRLRNRALTTPRSR
jgi:hypothetical protein